MEKSWKFVGKNVYEPCCEWHIATHAHGVIWQRDAKQLKAEWVCATVIEYSAVTAMIDHENDDRGGGILIG